MDGDSPHKCTLCSEPCRNGSKRGITTAHDLPLTRRDLRVGCAKNTAIIIAEFFTIGTTGTGSCFTGISQLLRPLEVAYYSFCTMRALICVRAAQGMGKDHARQYHGSQLRKSREHKNKMAAPSEKFPGIPGTFQRCTYSS